MSFVSFMSSTAGRIARVVVGVVLIIAGIAVGGTGGIVLIIVGLLPIGTGVANVCLLGPLVGAGLKGDGRAHA